MSRFILSCLATMLAIRVYAQSSSTMSASQTVLSGTRISTLAGIDGVPTEGVTYISYLTTVTLSSSSSSLMDNGDGGNGSSSNTASSNATADPVPTATLLVGTLGPNNATASATDSSPRPSNTAPCNGHPEFCTRGYGNITMVAAHNSPFTNAKNAARNQDFGVLAQLNDGVRMLQGQTHVVDGTVRFCHTRCDLLDAGPAEAYFASVAAWLGAHPYDVVTILIGNGDAVPAGAFVAPLEASGLARYAYVPAVIPMALADWPTLGELVLRNDRAVIFMDYNANQSAVPYILDEFSQLWETPFSPQDPAFPCTVQRPPGLDAGPAARRLYMANHNLNTNLSALGLDVLVPNTVAINETNGLAGLGSLGLAANNCAATWGRPPNFLLVDYYNRGDPYAGSVFEVAARANNVTYTPGNCCGLNEAVSAAGRLLAPGAAGLALLAIVLAGGAEWLGVTVS